MVRGDIIGGGAVRGWSSVCRQEMVEVLKGMPENCRREVTRGIFSMVFQHCELPAVHDG